MTKQYTFNFTVGYTPLPDNKRAAYNLAIKTLAQLLAAALPPSTEAPEPKAETLPLSIHTPNIPNFPGL